MSDPLRPSFATVLDDLWQQRFTGRFLVDCQSGVPIVIEIPEEPQRIRLDTAPKDAPNYAATVESR